jgi:hypothetical protein
VSAAQKAATYREAVKNDRAETAAIDGMPDEWVALVADGDMEGATAFLLGGAS